MPTTSAEMLRIARSKASAARCLVRFTVGDACALDEPDDCFNVVRPERTLQWLADPIAAVAEMAQVVRPGGRISLIDTDWSTFAIDVGDDDLVGRVRHAMRTERGRPFNIGRRLHDLVRIAGFAPFARAEATQTWTAWNPKSHPHPTGASPCGAGHVCWHRCRPCTRGSSLSDRGDLHRIQAGGCRSEPGGPKFRTIHAYRFNGPAHGRPGGDSRAFCSTSHCLPANHPLTRWPSRPTLPAGE